MKKIWEKISEPFKIELTLVSTHLEKELIDKLGTFSKLKSKAVPELIRDAIKFYFEKHYYINLSMTQAKELTGNEIINLMFYQSLPRHQTPHEVKVNAKLVTYMLPKKYLRNVAKKDMSAYITSALCEYFSFGYQYTKNKEKLEEFYIRMNINKCYSSLLVSFMRLPAANRETYIAIQECFNLLDCYIENRSNNDVVLQVISDDYKRRPDLILVLVLPRLLAANTKITPDQIKDLD